MTSLNIRMEEAAALDKLLADINRAQFARETGFPGGGSMIAQHTSGHRPISVEAAKIYSERLDVPVSYFSPRLAAEIEALRSVRTRPNIPHARYSPAAIISDNQAGDYTSRRALTRLSQDEFVQVRRTNVRFSNGVGQVVVSEDDGEPLMFRADFLRRMGIRPADAVVVRADGISNEPKIADDAVVLVNRGDRDRLDGGFFAFRVDGELLIKRLQRLDGVGVLAIADNPDYKPKTRVYKQSVDFEIIGRAVWVGAIL